MRLAALVLCTLLAFGCGPTGSDEAGASSAALAPALGQGELLLGVRDDGAALFGRPLPAPPNSDGDRVLALRAVGVTGLPDRVLDARFTDGGVLVLGVDHALTMFSEDGPSTPLDQEVYGPLSVEGSAVAYVRGEPPFLEVWRADARTGARGAITTDMAPTWNPALTPDGESVVFVSGADGGPRLFMARGGATTALPATRVPTSATAPRIVDGVLVFEDEEGVAWLDLSTSRVERELSGRRGLAFLADGRAVDATLAPLSPSPPSSGAGAVR